MKAFILGVPFEKEERDAYCAWAKAAEANAPALRHINDAMENAKSISMSKASAELALAALPVPGKELIEPLGDVLPKLRNALAI